jgi:hypothetical protein
MEEFRQTDVGTQVADGGTQVADGGYVIYCERIQVNIPYLAEAASSNCPSIPVYGGLLFRYTGEQPFIRILPL